MAKRGQLRVYLGAAPGVGKTYRMLDEGNRRLSRGTDVVVAYVETHGRQHTAERIGDLPVIPRLTLSYRGAEFEEMNLDAVLERKPQVALVDELAHTNIPGTGYEKRWQAIEVLLEAGIDVISTVNIQHLESLNDLVQSITGVPQRETVPDSVVRAAEQIELVDMTPEALRRRMAHGNIYQADKVDAALSNYFRPGNLTALREIALLWLADSVEEGLRHYRQLHGIDATWETKERIVVALTGGPEGESLIRRAARIAARTIGAELLGVHIARSDGLAGSSVAELDRQRHLLESVGGTYHSVLGDDVADAVLDFARANNATQIVIGASRRSPFLASLTGPGTGMTITRRSGPIDVHVVTHEFIGKGRVLPRLGRGVTRRRQIQAIIFGVIAFAVLTPLCAALRTRLGLASDVLIFLSAVVSCSLLGGFWPAMAAALAGSLLLNYYFVPPIHTWTIADGENVLALVGFVLIAGLVARVVDQAARRNAEAARSNAEAETMSTLAGSLLRGEQALPALLERVRETFGVETATLLQRDDDAPSSGTTVARPSSDLRGTWSVIASVGDQPCARPEDADTEVPAGEDKVLVLRGRKLAAEDQRLLTAFATEVAVAFQQRQLAEVAEAASRIAEADRARTALLNAVSHDLRTPIATAKAAVSSLLSEDVSWSVDHQRELLLNAGDSLDRLTNLVTNLLDLSRLQAGALSITLLPVALEDVVSRALKGVPAADTIDVDVSPELPEVLADAGLLERSIANLVDNALRYQPDHIAVRVAASAHGNTVELRIIDRGPGIPPQAQSTVFEPFQRLDDHAVSSGAGVGLGLAIARGLTEAMQGHISLEDTPGGGLTAVVGLPIAGIAKPAANVDDALGTAR